jgi:hypothetical protein
MSGRPTQRLMLGRRADLLVRGNELLHELHLFADQRYVEL